AHDPSLASSPTLCVQEARPGVVNPLEGSNHDRQTPRHWNGDLSSREGRPRALDVSSNALEPARSSTARILSPAGMRQLPTESGTASASSRSNENCTVAFTRPGKCVAANRRAPNTYFT